MRRSAMLKERVQIYTDFRALAVLPPLGMETSISDVLFRHLAMIRQYT